MQTRRLLRAAVVAAMTGCAGCAFAQETFIVVASTTSTQDSGLFGYLLPLFKTKTGIDVKVVAQGTSPEGQRTIARYAIRDQRAAVVLPECQRPGGVRPQRASRTTSRSQLALNSRPLDPATNP